jgi:hypothetical protein
MLTLHLLCLQRDNLVEDVYEVRTIRALKSLTTSSDSGGLPANFLLLTPPVGTNLLIVPLKCSTKDVSWI